MAAPVERHARRVGAPGTCSCRCFQPGLQQQLVLPRSHGEPRRHQGRSAGRPPALPALLCRECPLMEVGEVFWVAGAPAPASGPGGTYRIPVRCQGGTSHALVDTGCTQTLVHQSLVHPGALLEAEWVEV